MTIVEARRTGMDVFFFGTREARAAHGQFEGAVPFEEHGGEGPKHFELIAMAVRPRTNTTAQGNRAFLEARR